MIRRFLPQVLAYLLVTAVSCWIRLTNPTVPRIGCGDINCTEEH